MNGNLKSALAFARIFIQLPGIYIKTGWRKLFPKKGTTKPGGV